MTRKLQMFTNLHIKYEYNNWLYNKSYSISNTEISLRRYHVILCVTNLNLSQPTSFSGESQVSQVLDLLLSGLLFEVVDGLSGYSTTHRQLTTFEVYSCAVMSLKRNRRRDWALGWDFDLFGGFDEMCRWVHLLSLS